MLEKKLGSIRIIAGKFRSRHLSFPAVVGLRPTPNRVRETLFNWLQKDIQGAVCLDLFAGSGALGFEALSRGALQVVMVEVSPDAIAALGENARLLGVKNLTILSSDLSKQWPTFKERFSLVFLDPPFTSGLLEISFANIQPYLLPGAWIYVETDKTQALPSLPHGWSIVKTKHAGAVAYYLLQSGQV